MAQRDWHFLLIGGGSGTGKTLLSEALARHFDVRVIEGDVLRWVIESAVAIGSDPDLHVFRDSSVWQMPADTTVDLTLSWSERLCKISEAVLVRHHFTGRPVVLEGVWILPEFAVRSKFGEVDLTGQIRSIFLYEPEIGALRERLYGRDGELGLPSDEPLRIESFYRHSLLIKQRAEGLGLPVLESRPFETLFDRALAILDT